jgi:alkylation response protein AidB-like acyl-CoA dehydrogenase
MAGERLTVLAGQPENDGFDFAEDDSCELPVHARRDRVEGGDRVILDGVACWIPTADAATYLVAAHAGRDLDDLTLIRVDGDTPGLKVHHVKVADGTTYARLELSGAVLPADAVLASGGEARAALGRAVDTAALITAAELLGLIDRMLELTLEYLGGRQQFGRPIGTFQVLQHRAVDMWVQQRLAEAALEGALRRVTEAPEDATMRAKAASSAKSRASSAALKVAGEAVQLHGAIGFTDEYELGRYVNRAFVLAASLGNARAHTRRHGRLVA